MFYTLQQVCLWLNEFQLLHIDILDFYGGSVYIFIVLLIVNRFVVCSAHLIIFMNTCAIKVINLLLLFFVIVFICFLHT